MGFAGFRPNQHSTALTHLSTIAYKLEGSRYRSLEAARIRTHPCF
jgi:hypothetical protein